MSPVPSLRQRVVEVMRASSEMLSARQVFERLDGVEDMRQVTSAIGGLYRNGLVRPRGKVAVGKGKRTEPVYELLEQPLPLPANAAPLTDAEIEQLLPRSFAPAEVVRRGQASYGFFSDGSFVVDRDGVGVRLAPHEFEGMKKFIADAEKARGRRS